MSCPNGSYYVSDQFGGRIVRCWLLLGQQTCPGCTPPSDAKDR